MPKYVTCICCIKSYLAETYINKLLSHVGFEVLTAVVMKSFFLGGDITSNRLHDVISQKIKLFCYHSTTLCYNSNYFSKT
jgi:hypothetical protein